MFIQLKCCVFFLVCFSKEAPRSRTCKHLVSLLLRACVLRFKARADPAPLVGLLEAAVPQHQGVGPEQQKLELVRDLPVALQLVDQLAATQTQLEMREEVPRALVALKEKTQTSTKSDYKWQHFSQIKVNNCIIE